MAWVKLDDGFFRHPKALAAGRDGRALFIASCCWAAANLTDGHVPTSALQTILHDAGVRAPAAARLVVAGLWEPNGDGWVIHDFLAYNPSRIRVESERAAARKRMAANRGARDNA